MKQVIIFFLICPLLSYGQISSDSKNLAWCEGVYIYYAQYFQIKNNEGSAKNLLFRASRVTTANLFLNLKDGKVSGEKIRQFKETTRDLKIMLDSAPETYYVEIDKCDRTTQDAIALAIKKNIIWDGHNYESFRRNIFNQYLSTLGLN